MMRNMLRFYQTIQNSLNNRKFEQTCCVPVYTLRRDDHQYVYVKNSASATSGARNTRTIQDHNRAPVRLTDRLLIQKAIQI